MVTLNGFEFLACLSFSGKTKNEGKKGGGRRQREIGRKQRKEERNEEGKGEEKEIKCKLAIQR